jgi:hypothetical protein
LSKYDEIIIVHPSNRASYEEMDTMVRLRWAWARLNSNTSRFGGPKPGKSINYQLCIAFYNQLAIFFWIFRLLGNQGKPENPEKCKESIAKHNTKSIFFRIFRVLGLGKLMNDLAWGRPQGLIQQFAQQLSQPRNPKIQKIRKIINYVLYFTID